ncbi:uncharacterized protein LOC119186298 [Rhipicephalus microplus]|uniref:uncharacterized protein LOC119186298 n=1 Tax=Rhipicephalus microplus TaxID=6941 RepID=UPI003F6C26F7
MSDTLRGPSEYRWPGQKMTPRRQTPAGYPHPVRRTTAASSSRERRFPHGANMEPGLSWMRPGHDGRNRPGMPYRMPGMMPGMMPRMMPGRMPGMVPGMMPRMMPGMMPAMMSGMVPGMVPAAYPGITPGISMVPGAPMMPSVLPVPIGGGTSGGGSRTTVIPMPLPMPMPLPLPSQGGGGGQGPVILAGTSPPASAAQQAYPCPAPCHQHYAAPPQQEPPLSPLVDAAAVTMMMQQIRLLLSPPPVRTRHSRQRSPEQAAPSPPAPAALGPGLPECHLPFQSILPPQAPAEGGPIDLVAALQAMLAQAEGVDSQKKPSKATGKRNKAGKKAEEDAETKHRMDGGKKPVEEGKEANGEKDREEKEEEKQSRKKKETEKQGDEVKKVDSTDEKLKSPLTQEGTTPGKGPDPNAPALSLNFQR